MRPKTATTKTLTRATIGALLLAIGLSAAEEEVITDGINVDVRGVIDPAPQRDADAGIGQDVQDFSDGTTNEGGVPEVSVDLRDAALEDEQNLGPNAPGYIP
ncbi:hypothetical protein [uncultured Lamprocystis sp.]|uniref:hypothetical protein n=1 Tax=uncultured Lamprocystis sp. TaxID=543132 RepID=UPI0025F17FA8|nr:hypothetical protein [uncultured Lamprocystis sp.]